MNQVHGMDLTLAYDSAVLGSPVVSWGNLVSGAVNVANTGMPGSIRFAVVSTRPLPDNGQVAQISFSSSNVPGGITSITAKLIDSSGTTIPVSATIAAIRHNPGTLTEESGSTTSTPPTDSQPQDSPAQSSTTPTILGVVSMTTDSQPISEKKPTEPPVNVSPPGPSAVPDDTAPRHQEVDEKKTETTDKAVEQKQVHYGSVLDRFKTYQGVRTPAAMLALFDRPVAPELRQEPLIAVSDGNTGVRIYDNHPKGSGSSPNFRLSDVKLVSLERDDETGALVLNVLPEKNGITASINIISDQTIATFPLTLIPPVAEVTTKETDFIAFLNDAGAQKPAFDLNSDGVHDYLDDYIYTGHYLVKMKEEARKGKK